MAHHNAFCDFKVIKKKVKDTIMAAKACALTDNEHRFIGPHSAN